MVFCTYKAVKEGVQTQPDACRL